MIIDIVSSCVSHLVDAGSVLQSPTYHVLLFGCHAPVHAGFARYHSGQCKYLTTIVVVINLMISAICPIYYKCSPLNYS